MQLFHRPIGSLGGGRRGRKLGPFLFILPTLLVIGVTVGFPLYFNVQVSLTDTRLLTPGVIGNFVGFENYEKIISSDSFWNSIVVTFEYTLSTVVASFAIGLAVALLLNAIGHRRRWMMTVLLIPWVVSPVVEAYVWRFLFNDEFGLVNELLIRAGLLHERVAWLASPETTVMTIIVCGTWRLLPYMVVMLVAGLQSIPRELYEAADVDGAGKVAQLFYVTIPQLRYIIAVVVMFALIWTFNDFTIPYVMTAEGGAASTRTLPILAYKTAFEFLRFGRASAMSTIILIALGLFSAIYVRVLLSDSSKQVVTDRKGQMRRMGQGAVRSLAAAFRGWRA